MGKNNFIWMLSFNINKFSKNQVQFHCSSHQLFHAKSLTNKVHPKYITLTGTEKKTTGLYAQMAYKRA